MNDTAHDRFDVVVEMLHAYAGPDDPRQRPERALRRARRRRLTVLAAALAAIAATPALALDGRLTDLLRISNSGGSGPVGPAAPAAPFAGAIEIRAGWVESKALKRGRIRFRVDRIRVAGDRWRVFGSVVNTSPYPLDVAYAKAREAGAISPDDYVGMGIETWQRNPVLHEWSLRHVDATEIKPRIRRLAPGKTWTLQFAGKHRIVRGRVNYVTLGAFLPVSATDYPPPGPGDVLPNRYSVHWTMSRTFILK